MKRPEGDDRPTTKRATPKDAPRGHAPGRDIDRVLLVGAGPAVGWGSTTHDLALPGAMARAISALTQRGCDVDLIADPDMDVAGAALIASQHDLLRYDAVVLMIGVNEALRLAAVRKWTLDISSLLSTLADKMPVDSAIIVVGANPIRSLAAPNSRIGTLVTRRALMLDRATASLCAENLRATFLTLPGRSAPQWRHATRTLQYGEWATFISDTLAPRLNAQNHLDRDRRRALERRPGIVEADRQDAVDKLQLALRTPSADLQRIVTLAQSAFKAESALVTVLDHDRQWHFASVGKDVPEVPRIASLCEFAIQGDEALVVRDTLDDDKFRYNPLVVGEPHIRFYAGFPIQSGSGQRLGTLCVIDSQPRRRADDIDATFLRQLAQLAQRELWKYLPNVDENLTWRKP